MDYRHQALDYPHIIQQLKDRGLLFREENVAVEELSNTSYFRIVNYLSYFEEGNSRHIYQPGTYFEDALYIYRFDMQLRVILFAVIQNIELALRSKMAHHIGLKYGPFWFSDQSLCVDLIKFNENLNAIKREVLRSKEEFILKH